jgi:hypothetical protein
MVFSLCLRLLVFTVGLYLQHHNFHVSIFCLLAFKSPPCRLPHGFQVSTFPPQTFSFPPFTSCHSSLHLPHLCVEVSIFSFHGVQVSTFPIIACSSPSWCAGLHLPHHGVPVSTFCLLSLRSPHLPPHGFHVSNGLSPVAFISSKHENTLEETMRLSPHIKHT